MPTKKPETEEAKARHVREEGRRGFLRISKLQSDDLGDEKIKELFETVRLQIFGKYVNQERQFTEYYCFCPLFAPLTMDEKTKVYVMRVDLKEPYPIIEMLEKARDL